MDSTDTARTTDTSALLRKLFGRKLRARRERVQFAFIADGRRLSREQLAAEAGPLSDSTIYNAEHGLYLLNRDNYMAVVAVLKRWGMTKAEEQELDEAYMQAAAASADVATPESPTPCQPYKRTAECGRL